MEVENVSSKPVYMNPNIYQLSGCQMLDPDKQHHLCLISSQISTLTIVFQGQIVAATD